MKFKEHPELSRDYSAINGIAKKARYPLSEAEKPIRSDIEEILSMEKSEFETWHYNRVATVNKLLDDYELVGSILDLRFGDEESKYTMANHQAIKSMVNSLKTGLEYLALIGKIRAEVVENK